MKRNKQRMITILLIAGLCLSLCSQTGNAFAAESPDGPKGIILSWSEDPTNTQTVTWSAAAQGEGKIRFVEAQQNIRNADFTKAKQIQAECIEVSSGMLYRFEGVLRNLKQDTSYWYQTSNGTAWSEAASFRTAPVKAADFQFMYLGDVQFEIREEDYGIWSNLISQAYENNPDIKFSLMGGDYVNSSGNIKDWNCFLEAAEPVFSKIPMMTVPGNHETSILPFYYLKIFDLPENGPNGTPEEIYSFDYGDCHFVELNTSIFMPERKNYLGESSWNQLISDGNQWLKADLESSSAKWKIVTMHHPAYGVAEDDEIYQLIRENWVPIFTEAKVDLVFCGHQHVTMRTGKINGVTYFMGNSGQKRSHYFDTANVPDYVKFVNDEDSTYQLVDVSKNQLKLSTYNQDSKLIDMIVRTKDDVFAGF